MRLVEKLYSHWSYGALCIYCFVGILVAMFYTMKLFSPSIEQYDFILALVIGITSVVAGMYIKIIGDMESNYVITEYINSVPEDRKDLARKMF